MLNPSGTTRRGDSTAAPAGFTVLEMVLVLVLSGLVLGIVAAVGIRLQHQLRDTASRLDAGERLAIAASILPLDFRPLSPDEGDIRAGEARDSSLEMRAAIASAITCGGTATTLVVAPFLLAGGRVHALPLQPGDTLWLLADGDDGESWRPVAVRAVRATSGTCTPFAADVGRQVLDVDHLAAIDVRDSVAVVPGAIVRATRPIRYSFYRAGDGLWYLGVRTWSSAAGQFNGIQPLSGPYAFASPTRTGTRITYYDRSENVIASGTQDTRGIARIELVIRADSGAAAASRGDSTRIVVAVRNRR